MKSSKPGNRAQRKVDYTNYYAITMRRNYFRKLRLKIITENYDLVYQSCRKVEIYRDTGVSKKGYDTSHDTTIERHQTHGHLNV